MKNFLFLFLLITSSVSAQIKGKITDSSGNALPYVNVFIENTYIGTTSNESGQYELTPNDSNITIVFQFLGYKTEKRTLENILFPYELNIVLTEQSFQLQPIVVTNTENPADAIIRNAIAARKENTLKTDKFEADFYSKGIFKAKDIPEKIMGIEIGDLEGSLDSTRSGVIYLSETVSKIKFEKPNKLTENIVASKVAGDNNGFSYNTALNANYDFYDDYIDLGVKTISPIASNAFSYYKYNLESTFYEADKLINKIKVTPKRDAEPVFEGYVYIVENSWAIYGVDCSIKGYRLQNSLVENMHLTQNYSYNKTNNRWVKNIQTLSFDAGFLGMTFTGKFSYVYSNYVFRTTFEKNTFGKEVVTFEKNTNKKDSNYWLKNRQIPLTTEETVSYFKKDSIQTLRTSQKYLDSIDAAHNKFRITDIISGYTYNNTYKNWHINYLGLLNFSSLRFNTVQGWSVDTGFSFTKYNEEKGKRTFINTIFNYGFSENRLRVKGRFYHRFNAVNKAYINIEGGAAAKQYNNEEPISDFINSISTLFFKNNFMKLYNSEFLSGRLGQEVTNGLYLSGKIDYEKRKPLFNTTNYTLIKNNDAYFSNNPIALYNYTTAPFETHHMAKAHLFAKINFKQRYISRPTARVVLPTKYPTINLKYTQAISATKNRYKYSYASVKLNYNKNFGNKGDTNFQITGGKFFNAEDITFIDYYHFKGNQTHVNFNADYNTAFNLLPYYTHSTNKTFLETHITHNFNGYLMNKVPLLNKLRWNLIAGYHSIGKPDAKPYHEFTIGLDNIGFGKFRFFRFDYIRAYQNGYVGDGIMLGAVFGM